METAGRAAGYNMIAVEPWIQGGPLAPRHRTSTTFALTLLVAASGCSSGETSSPGFPRTELAPIEGAPLPYASPEDVGLPARDVWLFKERLYARVRARHVVGSEILVVKNGHVVLHQAMGWADIERAIPMERNAIFALASMTKPVSGTVALQLVEEGRLSLDDPRLALPAPVVDG